MNSHDAVLFLWGAIACACWVGALFFLKYWRRTHDRLFLFFSAAFWIFSLNWILLANTPPDYESRHWVYFVRVAGFACMIAGILEKNRGAGQRS